MKIRRIPLFLLFFIPHGFMVGQISMVETENLRTIVLEKANEYIVPHAIRCFENANRFCRQLFHYQPWDKQYLFLQDLGDYGNAGAGTIPRNVISLSIAPYNYVFETSLANERINFTINHEMIHIVTLDKAGPPDRFFRRLFFGKVSPTSDQPLSVFYRHLTNPRSSSPRWYTEGIAVFMETWNSGGLGRAMGSYDEMVFRTRVNENAEMFDVLAVEAEGTAIDFQGGAIAYLFGTRFMSYLAYQYGPEKLIHWVSRTDDSKAYFASQFKSVYGRSLAYEWNEWVEWERGFQRANIDSIRANTVTEDRAISRSPLGSMSKAFYDAGNNRLYAAIRYPGQVASIVAINPDDGTFETLGDVKGAALYYVTSTAYDPTSQKLFFTINNNDWRDLATIDLKTKQITTLMREGRVGDLVFNKIDNSLWGVRHAHGISTIVRIPPPYSEWNQVYSFPYGKDVYDLDISPDGKHMTAGMAEISGEQKLILMDIDKLMQGNTSYEILFDFEYNTPSNFVFTPDGGQLLGSSYYTGVSNVFRYTFETETMEVMTNAETGYFRPVLLTDDTLLVFRYTASGFLPAKLALKPVERVGAIKFLGNEILARHPIVTSWKLDPPSPERFPFDTLRAGPYEPFKNISLASAYPIVEGYKEFAGFGMRFNFSDPILLHNMHVTISYTPNSFVPKNERLHLSYHHTFWEWTLRANYNTADFYDLFGPTKASRKGYSASIQYKKYVLYDTPKTIDYTLSLTGYANLERLPDFQNVSVSFDRFVILRGALTYKHFERSIGAVDDEKGIRGQIISRSTYVLSNLYPHFWTNGDYGMALPLNHSSIWLRGSAGLATGNRNESFANFFFGGFGNNWVDYLEAKRYREDYSFPGVGLNAVDGSNYAKGMLEWTLPPIRFRSLGVPSLYSNWARVAVFATGLLTNIDDKNKQRTLFNVGCQIDFRISFLSRLESTFSIGYALARERGFTSDEVMISLKLL